METIIAHFPKNQTSSPVNTVLPKGKRKELIKPRAELNELPTTETILFTAVPNSPKSINSTKGNAITKPININAPAVNKAHFIALLTITATFQC